MAIVKAYTLPHPPLVIPSVGKGKENLVENTLAALGKVSKEIAECKPETIVFITPHSVMYSDYFHISPGKTARGDFARFGAPEEEVVTNYDEELAYTIEGIAETDSVYAGTQGEKDKSLDHGTIVPMWCINKNYSDYSSLRISQSGMSPAEHYRFGQVIAKAIKQLNRKTVIIASSDLSHKLQNSGACGYASEGAKFDALVTENLSSGDFLSLLKIPDDLRRGAGECGYNSLMILAGCLDRHDVDAELLSYEGPFGVGYAVARFIVSGYNEKRDILDKYMEFAIQSSKIIKNGENEYQNLARRSLEHVIETGDKLPIPNDLPSEMKNKRAGVFVSLHINGSLRGCIGTIAPTTESVADEIIQNVISAGLSDNRFSPVTKSELPLLTYKVDVLQTPEPIKSSGELDVKKYGVIISSGHKRGLLLPNLDGVNTVEEQINIARQKAGISPTENYKLERFEVIRHG
ncbi:MAG: AmmeMemoRadiSam system protein A [Oscillospiraceae bacterium]|nr:AmmeMemoRadiSam system protein A [Oscillospiraceae bacterium]MCL2278459.1 AmmeMemoRadiSam system protein A [Oscillospiraceae bacterium]